MLCCLPGAEAPGYSQTPLRGLILERFYWFILVECRRLATRRFTWKPSGAR
jgi:hypothetical protein